ncbi:MAG: aldo/keto reductase [Bacillota bacterium]|nr:aldo/keto reductase [Bacillota bacterium]
MISKRQNGRLPEQLSRFGFGVMRLPMRGEDIDLEQTQQMIDAAMAAGVNYYDTAYVYYNGLSEQTLAKTLVERYPRHSFYLADKLPGWKLAKDAGPQQMLELLDKELEYLHTDYLDFFLIHSVDHQGWPSLLKKGVLDFLQQLRAGGKVRHIGFSYHDTAEYLPTVLADFAWEFVQLQLNYYDWDGQQNARGQYQAAVAAGLPVIVMEPVRGGMLAELPAAAAAALRAATDATPAALALRWAASLDNVAVVLSGVSNIEQMRENIATFSPLIPLDARERQAVDEIMAIISAIPIVPCTGCKYCVDDCPKKIGIPAAIEALNEYRRFGHDDALNNYWRLLKPDHAPDRCIECGECVKYCPQKLAIPEHMWELSELIKKRRQA